MNNQTPSADDLRRVDDERLRLLESQMGHFAVLIRDLPGMLSAAVSAGVRSAVTDPDTIKQAGAAIKQVSAEEAKRGFGAWVWSLVRPSLTKVALALLIFALASKSAGPVAAFGVVDWIFGGRK
jgi:hypothetical protein